jgi:hypothetical protein
VVTLNTGIMFLLFTYMHSGCGEFYEGGPHVRRPLVKWSVFAQILRNTAVRSSHLRQIIALMMEAVRTSETYIYFKEITPH